MSNTSFCCRRCCLFVYFYALFISLSFFRQNQSFIRSDPYRIFFFFSVTTAPVKQHQLEAEVVFVIDSSYEVTQEDYKKQKEFIKSLVRDLDLSSNRSRAALITYGDRGTLTSRFIGLKNLDALDKSIDNASYVGGDRRIDKGLKMVARALNEAGATTTKLVIFLTAGKQASSGGSLGDAVQPIRQFGAKTFVIAIGKKPDVQELRPLVASPENVVTVVSFKELKSQTTRVASHISENAGKKKKMLFRFLKVICHQILPSLSKDKRHLCIKRNLKILVQFC